jgi:hypothetical protein
LHRTIPAQLWRTGERSIRAVYCGVCRLVTPFHQIDTVASAHITYVLGSAAL